MSIKIRIVSDFDKRGLTEAEKALGGLSKAAGIALAAVGAAVAGIAVKSVQEFAKFDAALTQSKAIMGDLTEAMEKDMADAAREVAKVTTFSAEQAAESFFFLASAGLDAEASIAALPRVAQFAQAGMFDMSRATDLLTDAQSALGLTIRDDAVKNMENMIAVSDVLVRANTLSNATVEQFSTSLTTKAGPALRTLGKDIEEGVAVLAAFADQGIKGEEAGTQLSIVLRDLSTKAIKNKEDFAALGVSVFDSNGEMRNLGDIIGNLETALDGMSDETAKATLLQLGFADRSVQSILALLGTSDAIKGYETALRSASGFTDTVANKQLETFNSQLKLLESAFIDVAIQIGEELTPYLQDLIPVIQDLLPIVGEKLANAFKQVDYEGLIENVANFTITIVENMDAIGETIKTLGFFAVGLITFTTITKVATAAMVAFNSALKLNIFALLAAGIISVSLAMTDLHYELKRNREAATGLDGRLAEINAEFTRLKELVDAGVISFRDYNAQINPLIAELATLEGQFGATTGEAGRFNNLKLAGVRAEIYATAEATKVLNDASKQYGLARLGLLTGEAFGRGAEAIAAANTPISTGPSAFEQTRDQVQRLIKDSQKQLRDAQKQYNNSAKRAQEDYASSVERLQIEFANRLEGIIQQSQDRLRNAYQSAVAVNISSLFERDENKSVEGLVKSLSDKLTASRNLLSNSAELASAGFSQTFIEQVVSAGTETGNELASAILNSTPEVQGELKELFRALEIESNQGMDALAESIYEKQGLATDALKDLYAQTQVDLANALIDAQTQLDNALLDAATALQDSMQSIRDNVMEQISEMDSGLGGLSRTVEQFIGKLDTLIARQREAQIAANQPITVPAPAAPTAPSIAFQPVPSTTPSQPRITTQPVVNINVKTDATQSPSMVGSYVAKAVEKYTSLGGSIKGLKVVPI
jgi:TP901 family phage tail tape measure protein